MKILAASMPQHFTSLLHNMVAQEYLYAVSNLDKCYWKVLEENLCIIVYE